MSAIITILEYFNRKCRLVGLSTLSTVRAYLLDNKLETILKRGVKVRSPRLGRVSRRDINNFVYALAACTGVLQPLQPRKKQRADYSLSALTADVKDFVPLIGRKLVAIGARRCRGQVDKLACRGCKLTFDIDTDGRNLATVTVKSERVVRKGSIAPRGSYP